MLGRWHQYLGRCRLALFLFFLFVIFAAHPVQLCILSNAFFPSPSSYSFMDKIYPGLNKIVSLSNAPSTDLRSNEKDMV